MAVAVYTTHNAVASNQKKDRARTLRDRLYSFLISLVDREVKALSSPESLTGGYSRFARLRSGQSRRVSVMLPNVRGHRADEMKDPTRNAAPEAPGGPRG